MKTTMIQSHFRFAFPVCLVVVVLSLLWTRVYFLQIHSHPEFREAAAAGQERRKVVHPWRGSLLDAEGRVLATTLQVYRLVIDPTLVAGREAEFSQVVAPVVDGNPDRMARQLKPRLLRIDLETGDRIHSQYHLLSRCVEPERWHRLKAMLEAGTFGFDTNNMTHTEWRQLYNLRYRAITAKAEFIRRYPNLSLASPLIGLEKARFPDGEMRPTGLERAVDGFLRGRRGFVDYRVNAAGRELPLFRNTLVDSRDGMNVGLTLDLPLQAIVEAELEQALKDSGARRASSLIVEVDSGRIRAWASSPAYDPNDPRRTPGANWEDLIIGTPFEPGSTFKAIVLTGVLEEGLVDLHDTVFCEDGKVHYEEAVLRDYASFGLLTVEEIVRRSSNIGVFKLSRELGARRFYEYVRRFGFGSRTGVRLAGEQAGTFPEPRYWDAHRKTRFPIGQGFSVTHLQMAMAYSAIANGGRLMRPLLVERLVDNRGEVVDRLPPVEMGRVASERTMAAVRQALIGVVHDPSGTGKRARVEGLLVGGKTGTAEVADKDGYINGKYIASFIGFFPADNPRYCLSVVIDEPKGAHGGGVVAAPVFSRIARRAGYRTGILPGSPRENEEPARDGAPSREPAPLPEWRELFTSTERQPTH